jgi:hypothetical protein
MFPKEDLERILANPASNVTAFSHLMSDYCREEVTAVALTNAIATLVTTTPPSREFGIVAYERITKLGSDAFGTRRPTEQEVPIIEGLIAYCKAGRNQRHPDLAKLKTMHSKFYAREARLTRQLSFIKGGTLAEEAYGLYTQAIAISEDKALLGTFYSFRGILAEGLSETATDQVAMMIAAANDALVSAKHSDPRRHFHEYAHACRRFWRAAMIARNQPGDEAARLEIRKQERTYLEASLVAGHEALKNENITETIAAKCCNTMARASVSLISTEEQETTRRQHYENANAWWTRALDYFSKDPSQETLTKQIRNSIARLQANQVRHQNLIKTS